MKMDKQKKSISEAVLERLLLSKSLLSPLRYAPVSQPNRQTLATHILASHDASELALAAIADHLNAFPSGKQKVYLMDFFSEIKKTSGREPAGKGYFDQLNIMRISIKHKGIFPEPQQWYRVAENTYKYISDWCTDYLEFTLDELDESALLFDTEVKQLYLSAKEFYDKNTYREALEYLAQAEFILFESNAALRGLAVGKPKAEDAIKLSAYGVNANDFLGLQEFLPAAWKNHEGSVIIEWKQAEYGHPANWHKDAVDFCLRTFLSVALRIQHAQWIPSAIKFSSVYEYEITILRDGVRIQSGGVGSLLGKEQTATVRDLRKGEVLLGYIQREEPKAPLLFPSIEKETILLFLGSETGGFGRINAKDVSVKCVPRKSSFVEKYHPNLPVIEASISDI